MKKIEKSLFEGFIDDILGGSTSIGGAGYDAETAATAEFEKKFLDRGLRAFNSAWKNDGIDLTKSGMTPSAPQATAAMLGLGSTPAAASAPAQPAQAPASAPQAAPQQTAPAPQAAPAPSATPQKPVAKRTGGRVKGYLSTNPRAVARRQATAAKRAAQAPAAAQPAAAQPAAAQPAAAQQPVATAPASQQPISIGGQKLNPKNPEHAKIIKQVQTAAKPRARFNPATKKWQSVQESYILSKKEIVQDKQLNTWDRLLESIMLSEASNPNGVSPSEFMYDIVAQQMRGYNLDNYPQQKKMVLNALARWENALKNQIKASQGNFAGKFDSDTQTAFNDLAELLSSLAFASLSNKATGQPSGQPRRTP